MGTEMGYSSTVAKWSRFIFLFLVLAPFLPLNEAVSDKSILVRFKASVSDPYGLISGWDPIRAPDHCSWGGVLCDNRSRVVSVNITGNNGGKGGSFSCGSGSVRFPLWRGCEGSRGYLVGELPSVVTGLTELKVLSLPFNGFGGVLPSEIWGMEKLEMLDLEGNSLYGSLPGSFPGLRNLRVLNLGFNRFEGGVPGSLASCESLEILNLVGNRVNGSVPGFVGRFRGVYLSLNQLGGSLPSDIGERCDNLELLDLSGNFLVGGIPGTLGNCKNLRTLLLNSNLFEEVIPPALGMLKRLEVLDLSRNSLSGKIPPELGNCYALSVLVLSNSFDPYQDVNSSRSVYLSDQSTSADEDFNFFQGGIPPEVLSLRTLRMLWAPGATLEGRLPSNWGACVSLEMVNLAHNFFSGPVLSGLKSCQKLWYMDFSNNVFDGELVSELPVPCMSMFDVSKNALSGSIPSFNSSTCSLVASRSLDRAGVVDASSAYLAFFAYKAQPVDPLMSPVGAGEIIVYHNFGGNNFTGSLQSIPISPARLGKKTIYTFLAAENKLSGPFPVILFEKCDDLKAIAINVSTNIMSGPIPADIGTMCSSLRLLDVSRNQITGTIPSSIGLLASLVALNLSWNLLQGEIPSGLGKMRDLKYLSLAGNNLTGAIPSTLGQLYPLEVLDLSSNLLTGKIPTDLVKLRNLSSLLLNVNKLSGEIPGGLANVTTLLAFNVSFNNLSGPLPSSTNLMKCSSVLGNPYLRPCQSFQLAATSPDSQAAATAQGNVAPPSMALGTSNGGFNSIEIASIASASAIVSVLLALVVLFFYTRKWSPRSRVVGSTKKEVTIFTDIGVPITFENVVRATGSFNASNCIGNGGFGATYKAEISPGVLVAIKRLSVGRFQGVQQFDAEIRTLARLHHPNLVTLIGYHASEIEMFLVYNYLPGGNLEKFIQERSTRAVDWRVLHKIALDVARALAYLHDQCVPRVLHRDVKPSNILLDEESNAYLSDFGLARLLGTSETHATTGVAGTFGYVAPEYAMTCRVSDKADVYSYGVVLLELLSDKKALDPSFSPYGNGFNIVAWGCMLLRQGRAKEFFTSGLWDAGPHDDLVEVLHLAVVCTVDSLSTRPTMKQVVRRLKQLQPLSC